MFATLKGLATSLGLNLPGKVSVPAAPPTPPPDDVPFALDTMPDIQRVQARLSYLGYLDPPADGGWGPVSRWALGKLCLGHGSNTQSNSLYPAGEDLSAGAQVMLKTSSPLPLRPAQDWAGRVIQAMIAKSYWICRVPGTVNIVYVEGHDPDGKQNELGYNEFNDTRLLISVGVDGVPKITGAWEATTHPGRYWTEHWMNPEGPFHIALGQQKAWQDGYYHQMNALVQAGSIHGFRDHHSQGIRDLRYPVYGDDFGVHHHWGYNFPRSDLGQSSAGCLVGRLTAGHVDFMKQVKADPRFRASPTYRFTATVLGKDEVTGA